MPGLIKEEARVTLLTLARTLALALALALTPILTRTA